MLLGTGRKDMIVCGGREISETAGLLIRAWRGHLQARRVATMTGRCESTVVELFCVVFMFNSCLCISGLGSS